MSKKKSLVSSWQLCLGLVLLAASGCISPNVGANKALASLKAGDDPTALVWSEKLKRSFYSKPLGLLETGRVRMLSGDFLGSSTNFASLIDAVIEETETGPVVKIGDVGAHVMAGTITDDRTRPYQVPAYEFIQALQYQMLNHLFLGKPNAAAVEARRAVFAQDAIAEKYGREVQRARYAAEAKQARSLGAVDARMQGMAPVLEKTRSSLENGLVWYFSGVLFEQDQDQANAALAYRKAWELIPGNPIVQRDFLRLIRTQDHEAFKMLVKQTGVDPTTLTRSPTEIILLLEEAFVPQRQSVKIPVPLQGVDAFISIDFPLYQAPLYYPMALEVRENGQTLGLSAMAVSVQALAYRDLKEKTPGIVMRNVTRVATQIAAQAAANASENEVAQATVFWLNVGKTLFTRADTRAWTTLPMAVQIYRGDVTPGAHTFELRNQLTGFVTRVPVTVAEGETRIIWMADLGGNARVATASLDGTGAPTTFQVCCSLLAEYPPAALRDGPRTLRRTGAP